MVTTYCSWQACVRRAATSPTFGEVSSRAGTSPMSNQALRRAQDYPPQWLHTAPKGHSGRPARPPTSRCRLASVARSPVPGAASSSCRRRAHGRTPTAAITARRV